MSGTETTAPTADDKIVCAECGSTSVQISLPAWFDPNDLTYLECDECADELDTWCDACEDHTPLKTPDGRTIVGRW